MIQLEKIDIEQLKSRLENKSYSLIYLNYDKKSGIKIVDTIEKLSAVDLEDFYRIYTFNDEFMITVYKFGEDNYRYNEITKTDFEGTVEEREIYIDTKGLIGAKKLKIRKGLVDNKEYLQYIEFVGGDR